MTLYIVATIAVALIYIVWYLNKKFDVLNAFSIVLEGIKKQYDLRQAKTQYPPIYSLIRELLLVRTALLDNSDNEEELKKAIQTLIVSAVGKELLPKEAVAIQRMNEVMYQLLTTDFEFRKNVAFILNDDWHNIDVRNITLLLISTVGQFFDLKNDLSQQYFKQLIYGINLILMELKDKGLNKDSVERSLSVLIRLYRLTQAYKSLHITKNISVKEYREKIIATVGPFTTAKDSLG